MAAREIVTSNSVRQGVNTEWVQLVQHNTLAMLNIEPPEPKTSGSNAADCINLAHLLGMLHIVDLIC
jgi:hypothetical protein